MTFNLTAFLSLFVASFILGATWYLGPLKPVYAELSGAFLSDNPVFPIGLAAITLNCIAMIVAFNIVYPLGDASLMRAIAIMSVVWAPHFVAIMATVAKYEIPQKIAFLSYELPFNLLNVVVMGTILHVLYNRFFTAT